MDPNVAKLVEWAEDELRHQKDVEAHWNAAALRERELGLSSDYASHQQLVAKTRAAKLIEIIKPFRE